MTVTTDLRPHRPFSHLSPARIFAATASALVACVALGALLLAPAPTWHAALPPFLLAAAMAATTALLRAHYPHATLGACNAVTLVRAALAALLTVAILAPATLDARPATIFAIAAAALALDGLDGWLARRAGLTSRFGARFDMEVDAALAAILATILMRQVDGPAAHAALAILGFSRYAFVAATAVLPWLAAPLPDRFSRKLVCVVQIGTLAALLAVPAAAPVLPLAAAALLWSFGRDILWLRRRAA